MKAHQRHYLSDRAHINDIRSWMLANAHKHIDPKTREVDMTALVEDWDRSCASGKDTMNTEHEAWYVAVDVCDEVNP